MHTCFLAVAFLSTVTASPLPDFSPLAYALPSTDQPNNAPIPFEDFFAESLDVGQPQILAQSPSTNLYSYSFLQPQILVENNQQIEEPVRGDSPDGNNPIPLSPTVKYDQSDLKFQHASCDATSSVCCQRAYNGESSQSASCTASMCFESPFSLIFPSSKSAYQECASEYIIDFAGSDHTPVVDTSNDKFGRYCLSPKYFSDCNQMWYWVWVSILSIPVPLFPHRIYLLYPFTTGNTEKAFSLT